MRHLLDSLSQLLKGKEQHHGGGTLKDVGGGCEEAGEQHHGGGTLKDVGGGCEEAGEQDHGGGTLKDVGGGCEEAGDLLSGMETFPSEEKVAQGI